eukprot:gene57433-76683_t
MTSKNATPSRFSLTALSAVSLGLAALLASCASTPPPGGRSVTIERTTFGIAHITAPDYEGLAYGSAYAHAQDNVCQTAEHLLTLRGDRSQFLGPQNTGDLGLGRAPNAQELFADGPHAGTQSFEIGDPKLRAERSLSAEISLRRRAGFVTGAVTAFTNRFNGYIFEEPTGPVAADGG